MLEVKKEELDIIEKELQIKFKDINIYKNRGIEFFKIDIKDKIISYLQEKNYYYKQLYDDDIIQLKRKYRENIKKRQFNIVINLTNKLKLLIKTYYIEEIKKINIEPKITELIGFIDFCKSYAIVAKK